MPSTTQLSELYRPVEDELSLVREEIANLWTDVIRLVNGKSDGVQPVGGKLLRPAMCLLSAGAIGAKNLNRYVSMASAMELLHMAALAHDDVIDEASLRRGKLSLNAMWDNHAAVLGGDYLVARGIGVLSSYDSCDVIANAVDCIRQMAEGELTDFGRGLNGYSLEGCLNLARSKTASLFAVSCSTPCVLRGGAYRDDMHTFGLNVGTAFQIVDDILDLVQNEDILGKPSCGDLIAGKRTLPILYLRDRLDDVDRNRIDSMRGATLTDADRAWVATMLDTTGALQQAIDVAREYSNNGCNALECLPSSHYKSTLLALAEFVLVRGS